MKIQLLLAITALLQWFCVALPYNQLLQESQKSSSNVIELTDKNFKRILGSPRDSYIVLFLTASAPQVGCSICLEAADEFKMIVNSWFKDHPEAVTTKGREAKSLFFAKSDLKDPQHIPKIFQFYNLQHVPRLLLYSPGGDINSYKIIDLAGNPGKDRAVQLINSVKAETKISDFNLYLPTDWSLSIVVAFVTFTVIYLFKKHSNLVVKLINLKPIWATTWTFFIILMLGGYMYNNIRNAQLAGVGSKGEIMYFLPGQTQNQFKIETQVVGVIYASITASILALIVGIPKLSSHYKGSSTGSLVEAVTNILFAVFVYAFFAALTSVFSIKQPGYPFQLMKLSSVFK